MNRSIRTFVCFAWIAIVCGSAVAQESAKASATDEKSLTVDNIFASGQWQEERGPSLVWSRKEPAYFLLEAEEKGRTGKRLVRVDCASDARTVIAGSSAFIPTGADKPLNVEGFIFSADEQLVLLTTESRRVWRRNTRSDVWLLDLRSNKLSKLGGNAQPSTLMFPAFSPDGSHVAYVREHNIYVQSTASLAVRQVTFDGSETIINGTSDWVNEEELDIRDGLRWGPDSSSIAFWQFDTSGVNVFTMIDNTTEKMPRLIRFPYPKVGDKNSAARIGVVNIETASDAEPPVTWLQIPGDTRENYPARVEWIPQSKRLIVQQFNRLQNVNRVWIAESAQGSVREAFNETDEAWLENENPVRWIVEGRELLWISERDGYRHAYRVNIEDGSRKLLTTSNYDLIEVDGIDVANAKQLYFAASPDNPTRRALYTVSLDGGPDKRLTPADQSGWHTYNISPDGRYAVHSYSTFSQPATVELVSLPDHRTVKTFTTNRELKQRLAALPLPKSEFFRVKVDQEVELDAWMIHPQLRDDKNGASQKAPLVVHVYGEPHGQTVRDAWQGPRGLWHFMLAQQGKAVVSIDNRGTMSPRGRAWRKSVHRQIGILASAEQAAAVKVILRSRPELDAGRVAVWGWSGGGSMSLNAIFRYPDVYGTAIAIASVPDQLLYDTIYQERYMGLPDSNAEGYKNGSPITFADGLKGNLLIIHGTGDDNCHYQGAERLINTLIGKNKQFDLMSYPNRSHSISEGNNTTRHLYGLMSRYLDDKLSK
ncbi:MAG: DPP IV N-terminal domain-containing protein [Pirellulales bacterium]